MIDTEKTTTTKERLSEKLAAAREELVPQVESMWKGSLDAAGAQFNIIALKAGRAATLAWSAW